MIEKEEGCDIQENFRNYIIAMEENDCPLIFKTHWTFQKPGPKTGISFLHMRSIVCPQLTGTIIGNL